MVRICLINNVEDPHEKLKSAAAKTVDDPFKDERRLSFNVVSCSGQEHDFPATELSKGAAGKGWQAQRFCTYPQELIIELESPSHVLTMQLLCHEYKISSKVEIFASVMAIGQNGSKQMQRLGHLSLDPNERTGFQARELKSIQVNAPASAIRLVLHACYTNKLNIYNQVGIVALVVTGEPLSEEQIIKHQLCSASPVLAEESPRPKIARQKLEPDRDNVDSVTGQRIRRLQQEKQRAVEEEDYDEAKRLKILIEKLRTLGQQINELERQKKMAVEEEDYDQAKYCKVEIQKLREINAENIEMNHKPADTLQMIAVDTTDKNEVNGGAHRESRDNSTQTLEVVSKDELQEELPSLGTEDTQVRFTTNDPRRVEDTPFHGQQNLEWVNAKAMQDELADNQGDEVLTPEALSEPVLKEFSDVLTVMDRYHLECFMSKHWQLRDKSLQFLEKELETKTRMLDTVVSFRAIHKVLTRGLNDRVSNVFFSSIQVLRAYVNKFSAEVPSKELHSCLGDISLILLEKLGDSNARTREAAADSLMLFAVVKEVGLNVIAPLMLKVPKTLSLWKPILGRLQWLLNAIPNFGLHPHGRSGSPGFMTEALMHFVVHCFNYPNGEVRNAAMKVTTEVYKIIGLSVEKYLKGVKPMIREVIIGLFEKTGEEELSAASSLQSRSSPIKAAIESSKQNKGLKLSDSNLIMSSSSQKGKNVIEGFERQSYPQPGMGRNKDAEKFELAQASSGRSSQI